MVVDLALNSVIQLPIHTYDRNTPLPADDAGPGRSMPLLGLGVFKNDDAEPAVLTALKSGYRWVHIFKPDAAAVC